MALGTEQYLGKINECSWGPEIKIASLYISSWQEVINYQPTYNCFQKPSWLLYMQKNKIKNEPHSFYDWNSLLF